MKLPGLKQTLSLGAIALFLTIAVASSDSESAESSAQQETTENAEATGAAEKPEEAAAPEEKQVVSKWKYSEKTDPMDDSKRYFAKNTSSTKLKFDFPYNGGSYGTITVRNMNGKNEVMLSISKGQFNVSIMGDEYCRIKFDDKEAQKVVYNSAADASMDYIFFTNPNQIIKNLKSAKLVKIEAPFFQEGRQVMDFEVEGLVWDR